MNIEISKVNVKLTKSLINQMRHAGLEQLQTAQILGYVHNIVKEHDNTLIMYWKGDYFILPTNYQRGCSGNKKLYRRVIGTHASMEWEFNTADELNEFWELYKTAIKNSKQIYI
jgi:hypothetical protein